MTGGRRASPVRSLAAGGAIGGLLGAAIAVVEIVRLALTVRGLGLRADLLLLGLVMYGAVGVAVGLLGGGAWWLVGWARAGGASSPVGARAVGETAPVANLGGTGSRRMQAAPVTRRAALRVGLGIASVGALGALALAADGLADQRGEAAAEAAPNGTNVFRALSGDELRPATSQAMSGSETPAASKADPPPAAAPPVGEIAAQEAPPTPRPRADGPPNVLLVTLDTVRADHLHAYGHPFVKTPSIDKLAAEGARFDMHLVQQPQTNPSHASLFTGMYPASSKTRVHMVDKIPANLETLATVLGAAGYTTAGLYSWLSLDPQYLQLQRGFQTYQNVAPGTPELLRDNQAAQEAAAQYRVAREYLSLPRAVTQASGVQRQIEETAKGRADLTTDAAIDRLRQVADRPFFMWVHYFDPHYPYQPPDGLADQYDPGYRGPVDPSMATVDAIENGKLQPRGADLERLVSLYLAEITFLDTHLGRLFAQLDAMGLRENTIVVLTSDHGEAFGEHSQEIVGIEFFHPHSLFNTEARTPLIVRYPRAVQPGTVVGAPVQMIDLFPTLLELTGTAVPPQAQGRSLVGLLNGSDDGGTRAAYSGMSDFTFTSVTVPGWKYIQNNASGRRQLFNLAADPDEQNDLSAARPDVTGQLAARTQAWMKAVGI